MTGGDSSPTGQDGAMLAEKTRPGEGQSRPDRSRPTGGQQQTRAGRADAQDAPGVGAQQMTKPCQEKPLCRMRRTIGMDQADASNASSHASETAEGTEPDEQGKSRSPSWAELVEQGTQPC